MKKKKKKLLIPKTDVVFQALFGTKGSERILEGLLTEILETKVENVSLDINQVLTREMPEDKLGILDLRANIGEKIAVNIEVQLINPYNISERILYYWSRIYANEIKNGEDYDLLKKTISILIIDFELEELKEFKDAHTKWKLLEKRNTKAEVFKNMEIHIIEIPKWLKNKKETKEGLGRWIEFLTNPESEMVKVEAMKNTKLREAYEKLEDISEDEETRIRAEIMRKRILDERNRNRVLGEIENRLKEEQKKIEEEQKKVEEEQKKVEEEQKKVEEEQKKVEEKQKKVEEKQRKIKQDIEKSKQDIEKSKQDIEKGKKDIAKREKNIIEREQKIQQRIEKIVKSYLITNTPIEKIIEYTGLTKEEIIKIKSKKE